MSVKFSAMFTELLRGEMSMSERQSISDANKLTLPMPEETVVVCQTRAEYDRLEAAAKVLGWALPDCFSDGPNFSYGPHHLNLTGRHRGGPPVGGNVIHWSAVANNSFRDWKVVSVDEALGQLAVEEAKTDPVVSNCWLCEKCRKRWYSKPSMYEPGELCNCAYGNTTNVRALRESDCVPMKLPALVQAKCETQEQYDALAAYIVSRGWRTHGLWFLANCHVQLHWKDQAWTTQPNGAWLGDEGRKLRIVSVDDVLGTRPQPPEPKEESVKSDSRQFQVGDLVECIDPVDDLKLGQTYHVTFAPSDGPDPRIGIGAPSAVGNRPSSYYARRFRLVEKKTPQPAQPMTGDRAVPGVIPVGVNAAGRVVHSDELVSKPGKFKFGDRVVCPKIPDNKYPGPGVCNWNPEIKDEYVGVVVTLTKAADDSSDCQVLSEPIKYDAPPVMTEEMIDECNRNMQKEVIKPYPTADLTPAFPVPPDRTPVNCRCTLTSVGEERQREPAVHESPSPATPPERSTHMSKIGFKPVGAVLSWLGFFWTSVLVYGTGVGLNVAAMPDDPKFSEMRSAMLWPKDVMLERPTLDELPLIDAPDLSGVQIIPTLLLYLALSLLAGVKLVNKMAERKVLRDRLVGTDDDIKSRIFFCSLAPIAWPCYVMALKLTKPDVTATVDPQPNEWNPNRGLDAVNQSMREVLDVLAKRSENHKPEKSGKAG